MDQQGLLLFFVTLFGGISIFSLFRTVYRILRRKSIHVTSSLPTPIRYTIPIHNEYEGMQYILFQTQNLWWAGYIKLPPTHPYYSLSTDQLPLSIHGGITFDSYITEEQSRNAPQEFSKGRWIGFDYGHPEDLIGVMINQLPRTIPRYTKDDIESKVKEVITQLKQAA